MNRWLVSSGAIVSSAMALYSWTNPSAFNLTLLSAQPDSDSKPLPREIEGLYDRLLVKARSVATHDQIAEAINTVAGIPKNSRSYGEAQQLQEDWTQELLQRASSQYKRANVRMAIWMLKAIPPTSQRHDRATELQQRWAKEWTTLRQASAAKKQGDWKSVMSSLTSLKDSMLYQSSPAQEMLQQATANLYSTDKTLVQISTVPINNSAVVPAMPSTADLNVVSLPQSSGSSGLLIDRNQALAWAEPPALLADGSPVGMERTTPRSGTSSSMSSMSNKSVPSGPSSSLTPPEFVPLEWAPPALAPAMPNSSVPPTSVNPDSNPSSNPSNNPESNSSGNSDGNYSSNSDGNLNINPDSNPPDSIPEPSAVPSHPMPTFSSSIAPDNWMALPPIDLLSPLSRSPGIKGGLILQSTLSAPPQMSSSQMSLSQMSLSQMSWSNTTEKLVNKF